MVAVQQAKEAVAPLPVVWVLHPSVATVAAWDTELCILVIPYLASSASRVVLSVSLERDFLHVLPPEHVTSLSVLQTVPPP